MTPPFAVVCATWRAARSRDLRDRRKATRDRSRVRGLGQERAPHRRSHPASGEDVAGRTGRSQHGAWMGQSERTPGQRSRQGSRVHPRGVRRGAL